MSPESRATERNYQVLTGSKGVPVKAWVNGVQVEEAAAQQLKNVASMPFVHKWVAAMPDVHFGKGATVGSVIPTTGAIIPAAVGVDIGCGMVALKTSLSARQLPDDLKGLRLAIEQAVPHGRTNNGGPGDKGAWVEPDSLVNESWLKLKPGYDEIIDKYPKLDRGQHINHLATLGTGNHFIEVCLDEDEIVWFMLHSGSRGVGNRIGSFFIELAKEDMRRYFINLPDQDLAYLVEGSQHFDDYVAAVSWAQDYAMSNRSVMMKHVLAAARNCGLPEFDATIEAINCHHNYVSKEHHFGKTVFVTRKGAVKAGKGDLGIIPGSMGAKSYIVRGKGNPESFNSCSHGAGRAMSREAAKKQFTLEDHEKATLGVECRKDADVIDETPGAYKSIDAVMEAQKDLVEVVHSLKQIVCVKG